MVPGEMLSYAVKVWRCEPFLLDGQVGDTLKKGQILCVLESMKMDRRALINFMQLAL